MRYMFYEHGELVAELDKCTVVSAADDAGVSTVLLNGKTYQRRKQMEFVQEWVAFDLVNKWAPSPMVEAKPSYTFKGLKYHVGNAAEFWMKECRRWQATFEELESKYSKSVIRHNETADRYAECRKERMQFQDRFGACSRALGSWLLPNGDIPQSIAKLVGHVSGLPSYHVNDGVGEDSPASTSSVKYFRGQIAERDAKIQQLESDVERLRNDKIVANGLIANLEGLAAADGQKIRDLESKLETVAASRERSIDDYNKSVAREGRLREEIQRINLRLADSEHERVRAVAVESELRARLAEVEWKSKALGVYRHNPSVGGVVPALVAKLAEVEHQRDSVLAQVESYEVDGVHSGCASEIGRLSLEVKDRDAEITRLKKHVEFVKGPAYINEHLMRCESEKTALRSEMATALKERDVEVSRLKSDLIRANGHATIESLRNEVDAALKERDQWRAEAKDLRKVVDERNKALDEARIDEKRSTDEMCRFQRKLHKIYLITIDAEHDK